MFYFSFLVMYSIVTLNANGLHDLHKWKQIWQNLPRCDIICLQEMHLTNTQIFAFQLHCPAYTWYYSLGMSNSDGVGIAVKKSLNVSSSKMGEISGRLLAVELASEKPLNIVNV